MAKWRTAKAALLEDIAGRRANLVKYAQNLGRALGLHDERLARLDASAAQVQARTDDEGDPKTGGGG